MHCPQLVVGEKRTAAEPQATAGSRWAGTAVGQCGLGWGGRAGKSRPACTVPLSPGTSACLLSPYPKLHPPGLRDVGPPLYREVWGRRAGLCGLYFHLDKTYSRRFPARRQQGGGRKQGLQASWKRTWALRGPRGQPGQRHREVMEVVSRHAAVGSGWAREIPGGTDPKGLEGTGGPWLTVMISRMLPSGRCLEAATEGLTLESAK